MPTARSTPDATPAVAAETTADVATRTPIETVEAFLDALQALDLDAARQLMTSDISYQNVPTPPVRGVDATVRVLRSFLVAAQGFEVEMLNVAADGDVVLTERIDTFTSGPFRAGFWVCGTFEVRDGRVALWRDRFDWAGATFALLKGLTAVPLSLVRR